ncbi:MAG: hypothetical protein ACRYF4_09720 [Janthinobacterium lividum]
MTPFSRSGFRGDSAFLSKTLQSGFRLRKRIRYRNSFARYLVAKVSPESEKTRIDARFRMSLFSSAFMIFWFGFIALLDVFAAANFAQTVFTVVRPISADAYMLLLIPNGMLGFGWLLVSFGLRLSRKGERQIVEFLEQTLSAQ